MRYSTRKAGETGKAQTLARKFVRREKYGPFFLRQEV
jgi:hypothetical protein